MGEKYGGRVGDCTVTECVSDQLLRLPFYTNMTETEQSCVIEALREFSVH
jgi:dTDP-4-amino-4,6-dideoxygalactose transaminase